MSQNTSVHTKKEFIKMLQDNMKEDEVVLWTQNTTLFEYKKKVGQKWITFGFADSGFEHQGGVGDLMRKGGMMGIVICKRDFLSQVAKDMVPETKSPSRKAKSKQ